MKHFLIALIALSSVIAFADNFYLILKRGYLSGAAESWEKQKGLNEAHLEAMNECRNDGGVLTKVKKLIDQNAIVAGLCVLKKNNPT